MADGGFGEGDLAPETITTAVGDLTTTPDRLTSALADRYTIERELGSGGMATVYLAEDLKHQRKVAVKVLRPELAAVLGAERFVQEITTTANLQHPHVLPLFDSGEADGFLYYVMPFIDGETLRAKLDRETQLGIEEAVRITTEVADALDYAHQQGVIHRDIKPENILLHNGRPMVADFGIALAVSAAAGGRLTETGLSLGTPHYMSPEQATAEKDLTHRSDVYSLACVLYEMLAGDPPHAGPTAQAIIMKIVTEEARSVTELRKTVPPHVAAALAKALEKLPADRFDSAAAFGSALNDPSFTRATLRGGRETGTVRRGDGHEREWWRTPGLLVTAGAIPALLIGIVIGRIATTPTPTAVPARFSFGPDSTHVIEFRCCGPAAIISRDGRMIAYTGGPRGGGRHIYVRPVGELEARQLPQTLGARTLFFSPDGNQIGYFGDTDRSMWVVPVAGGAPRTVVRDPTFDFPQGAVWLPDNTIVVATRAGGLSRVSAAGGSLATILEVDAAAGERGLIWPDVLPDGKTIIFSVVASEEGDWEDRVDALSLTTTERTTLALGWQPRYADGHLLTGHGDGSVIAQPIDVDRMTVGREARIAESVITRPDQVIEYAISATGTLVTAQSVSHATLIIASTDGQVEQLPITGDTRAPRFSPDGARIAYQSGSIDASIWIYDLERHSRIRLVANGAYPAWTPSGDSILFLEGDELGRAAELYHSIKKISADGAGTAETIYEGTITGPIDVSRDGRWLAWPEAEPDDPFNSDILYSSRDSSLVSRPFLQTRGVDELDIALSPDARWALVGSDEGGGAARSYLRAFPDGTNRTLLGPAGLTRWSPDGSALFGSPTSSGFSKVTVEFGAQVRVIDRFYFGEAWVHAGKGPGNNYGLDVHPDGSRIVAPANPASEAQSRFVVVVNALR